MNEKVKYCLITGATSGIGRATAYKLADAGYYLILVSRNEKKGRKICIDLSKKYGIRAEFYSVDFSSLTKVKEFATRLKNKFIDLQVIINNAGARFDKPQISQDGYEMSFAVNYLSHFCLTMMILDSLKINDKLQIINVISNAHFGKVNKISYQLGGEKYSKHFSYGQSKLALVMFTFYHASSLSNTKISVNAYDPGYVASNFAKNNGIIAWLKFRILFFVKRKLKKATSAADDIFNLISTNELNYTTGKYFFEKTEVSSSKESYENRAQIELWNLSNKLCGRI